VIIQMMEEERKEWIVITSDREIMDHAWKNSSVPVPSDQFLEILDRNNIQNRPTSSNAPAPPGTPSLAKRGEADSMCLSRGVWKEGKGDSYSYTNDSDSMSLDEDYDEQPVKGSPRQRSKKEKALLRVLNKL